MPTVEYTVKNYSGPGKKSTGPNFLNQFKGGSIMKKIFVFLLAFTLLFAASFSAFADASGPTFGCKLQYENYGDTGESLLDTRISMNGSFDDTTTYSITLQNIDANTVPENTDDGESNSLATNIREAYITAKTGFGTFQFGKFRYNPDIMDTLGDFTSIVAPFGVKYSYSLGENTTFAAGVIAKDYDKPVTDTIKSHYDAGAYTVEFHQNQIGGLINLGLAYQDIGYGVPEWAVQLDAQVIKEIKLYFEYDRPLAKTDNKENRDARNYNYGGQLTLDKFYFIGERECSNGYYVLKAGYNFTDHVAVEAIRGTPSWPGDSYDGGDLLKMIVSF